jgi:hypothetical protein
MRDNGRRTLRHRSFRLVLGIASLAGIVFCAGCASMLQGKTKDLSLSSDSTDVDVYLNGAYRGKTPLMVRVDRGGSYLGEFRHKDLGSRFFTINRRLEKKWLVLDAVTGLVPAFVDASTGAWYMIEPQKISVRMGESQELLNWKISLALLLGKAELSLKQEGWISEHGEFVKILQSHGLTPEEWVYQFSEDDYANFTESNIDGMEWLASRMRGEVLKSRINSRK